MKFYNAYLSWIWIVRLVILCLFTLPAGLVGVLIFIPCLCFLISAHNAMSKKKKNAFQLCVCDLLCYPIVTSVIVGIILIATFSAPRAEHEIFSPIQEWLTWGPFLFFAAITFIRAIPAIVYFAKRKTTLIEETNK